MWRGTAITQCITWYSGKSSGGAAYLFAVAGRIACKDASLFEAFSGPWTSASTFYKLL